MESNQRVTLRLKEVVALLSLSRSTVYALMNPRSSIYDKSFPVGVLLTPHRRVWLREDVLNWLRSRKVQ